MSTKITCDEVVRFLKRHTLSTPAKNIAGYLGCSSRAVATALRDAVADGRVTCTYRKGVGFYRFVRLKAS